MERNISTEFPNQKTEEVTSNKEDLIGKKKNLNDENFQIPKDTDAIERNEDIDVNDQVNNESAVPIMVGGNIQDLKILQHNIKDNKVTNLSKEEIEQISKQEEKEAREYLKNYKPSIDRDELHLLYREFRKHSDSKLIMTKQQFIDFFTPFSESSELTVTLMNAIDRNCDQKIQFHEFVQALSIMCRGQKNERLRLSKEEVYSTVSIISEIFNKFGFSKDRFGSPSEVVDAVFSSDLTSRGQYLHSKNELSLKEFLQRGELNPDLAKCFGMFDYFYLKFIMPLDLLFKDRDVNLKGKLTKIIPRTIFNFNISHRRKLSIKDGFLIVYKKKALKHDEEKPSKVIFLPGSTVKVVLGSDQRRRKFLNKKYNSYYGFRITKGSYNRFFLMENREDALNWINAIRFSSRHGYRFQSFAKVREDVRCQWFINGCDYYGALAEAIRGAKHEIFITGWWVSPYVYLERDNGKEYMEKSRLDRILTEKAKEGVKVYVLMWNETNLGVQLGSRHGKHWLEGCHSNIHVIRHPKRYPLSWSHHQKSAVIDQQIAFVGGIDICLMRYDTSRFQLTDDNGQRYPGKDFGNLTGVVVRTGDPNKDQFNRKECPRMPWHDVHTKIVGSAAKDAASNFIQRWNHALYSQRSNRFQPILIPKDYVTEEEVTKPDKWRNIVSNIKKGFSHVSYGREKENIINRAGDNPKIRQLSRVSALSHNDEKIENKPDKNKFKKQMEELDPSPNEYYDKKENQYKFKKTPTTLSEKEQEELIDEEEEEDYYNSKIPHNKPGDAGSSSKRKPMNLAQKLREEEEEEFEQPNTPVINLKDENLIKSIYNSNNSSSEHCIVQLVRSVSPWSAGSDVEDSCYKAYISLIKNSQHFIYIQNLFFISSCGSNLPKNRIALAILNRVRRAINAKQKFRVIVMVPISPSGDIALASSRMIIGWTNRTICQGGQSILELLRDEFPDVDLNQYLSFNSIRQWEENGDRIFTEQIYVHSKVLIVDDRIAVIGSCNINDRSMMGSRDSELAVVVSDTSKLLITMDGKPFKVNKFPHTLRVGLWKTHMNLNSLEISSIIDPISDNAFINVWRKTARDNSIIYKEVFGDYIIENQRRLGIEQRRWIPKSDEKIVQLSQVRGVLIEYPLEMFCESNLFDENVSFFNAEYYVDVSVFT
ncbi:hypothetical protein DICPUDRAFT_149141 [Dictyostelium purpureum]|uniref:phospholipase D n=1 Tax=Dictyostelium purpureum TaxID=5786 RepID=F0ZCY6_DICPU|nr:uncharacterized protein DICPUDRAFT_149141 [Dictyostelium purpureum]EGC38173.1 hypothetical protein DICPUDRAFT_149141 [Dictyostelium purpureum]|eukprot:XP_003285300.1 hypothetical protein DICPUDRAFT_149141 [Dictyostelium purpureum]